MTTKIIIIKMIKTENIFDTGIGIMFSRQCLDHAITGTMWIIQRLKGVHEGHAVVISTFKRKLAVGLLTIKNIILIKIIFTQISVRATHTHLCNDQHSKG